MLESDKTAQMPSRILRLRSVIDRTGLSRSTLYRKIGEGTFPRQIRLSARCAGWRESAIERWLLDPMRYRSEGVD